MCECVSVCSGSYLCGEGGVGVLVDPTDAVLLGEACHLLDQPDDGLELLVRLPQGLLELLVGVDEALQPDHTSQGCCCMLGHSTYPWGWGTYIIARGR